MATVSRVLNGSALVSPPTEERVRAAIEQLGYRRSRSARSLAGGASHAVGVVAPFFTSPSVVERLRGVAERLTQRGYDLVLFDVENARQRSDALSDFARSDWLDGLLVISLPLSESETAALVAQALPVVMIDVVSARFPHVAINDVRGGELATRHLLAKGHRTIGFVGDDPDQRFGFTSSERRREGYRRALEAAGVRPAASLEARGLHGRVQARELASRLLRRPRPPSAIFAASDVQAVGVLEAAAALGLRVPADLAVIGFDDVDLASAAGLSTVRQPLYETGARGADALLGAIEGRPPLVSALEPLRVVERRTT